MKINQETRTLTLGKTSCRNCREGSVPTKVDCPKCLGTGKGPRGGRNTCRPCHGHGYQYNQDVRKACPTCHGDWEFAVDENICNHINSSEWVDFVNWDIQRFHGISFNIWQQNIGIGASIYTCVDYGRAMDDMTDSEIMEAVLKSIHSTQAINVVRRADMKLCDRVVIAVTENGYAPMPVWDQSWVAA